jgi:hypothetical protein
MTVQGSARAVILLPGLLAHEEISRSYPQSGTGNFNATIETFGLCSKYNNKRYLRDMIDRQTRWEAQKDCSFSPELIEKSSCASSTA